MVPRAAHCSVPSDTNAALYEEIAEGGCLARWAPPVCDVNPQLTSPRSTYEFVVTTPEEVTGGGKTRPPNGPRGEVRREATKGWGEET
jgi:hypothetical protein